MDGSVVVTFGAFADGNTGCYAKYKIMQGTLMNVGGSSALGLPGTAGAGTTTGGALANVNTSDPLATLQAVLNSSSSASTRLGLLAACLLAFLAMF